MFNNKFGAIAISVIILAVLAIGAGMAWAEEAMPPFPTIYSGTVFVAGQPYGAGLNITASILDWTTSEADVTNDNSLYELAVAPPNSSYAGQTIYFYVNGVQASETDTQHYVKSGEVTNFNLHVTALPTPTPTPTMTPTPTAIPISSNGNGIIGTSGGTVNTSDGTITITFPGGAFNASTNVSIQGGACQGNASGGFAVGGTCFNVTPDGALSANATICVNLSAADFSIVYNKSNVVLTLGYWANDSWHVASNITITGSTICGQTNHLSDWSVLGATVNSTPAATPTPSTTPTSAATPTPSTTPTSTTSPTPTPTHTPSQTNGGGTNWALIGGIAGGVLLLAVIIIAMNSRRRGGGKSSRPRRSSRKAKPKK